MSNPPLVSVCIPSYRAERYIAETIRSVFAQTFADFELVIVDDCSDDRTVEMAREACAGDDRAIITVNTTNLGPAGNWNAAVERAKGKYVKVLCSDDLLAPQCLDAEVDALERHPSAVFVAARRDIIDGTGKTLFAARGLQGLSPVMEGPSAMRAMVRVATTPFGEPSVVLMRRDALMAIGAYRPDYGTLLDVDCYARLLRLGDVVCIDETLASFRVRASSWSDEAGRVQGRTMRRFLLDLATEEGDRLPRHVLWQGLVRSYVNQWGRQLVFAFRK